MRIPTALLRVGAALGNQAAKDQLKLKRISREDIQSLRNTGTWAGAHPASTADALRVSDGGRGQTQRRHCVPVSVSNPMARREPSMAPVLAKRAGLRSNTSWLHHGFGAPPRSGRPPAPDSPRIRVPHDGRELHPKMVMQPKAVHGPFDAMTDLNRQASALINAELDSNTMFGEREPSEGVSVASARGSFVNSGHNGGSEVISIAQRHAFHSPVYDRESVDFMGDALDLFGESDAVTQRDAPEALNGDLLQSMAFANASDSDNMAPSEMTLDHPDGIQPRNGSSVLEDTPLRYTIPRPQVDLWRSATPHHQHGSAEGPISFTIPRPQLGTHTPAPDYESDSSSLMEHYDSGNISDQASIASSGDSGSEDEWDELTAEELEAADKRFRDEDEQMAQFARLFERPHAAAEVPGIPAVPPAPVYGHAVVSHSVDANVASLFQAIQKEGTRRQGTVIEVPDKSGAVYLTPAEAILRDSLTSLEKRYSFNGGSGGEDSGNDSDTDLGHDWR
ncbi:hypothetical protein [Stenotrophomonas sp. 22385]|uniref:hypothetical protein n=1 Tax=Stenotrophomonas sp. 22385 TaxID=3453915 RepID=UPI003F864D6D